MPDAIVVGAGICGAAAAHFLAERGMEVEVIDRSGIARETSARGEGNVLVCDKPPGLERELAVHGRALWEQLGERFAAGRVTRKGALLLDPVAGGEDMSSLEPALAGDVTALLEPGDLQVDAPGMSRALLDGIEVREGAAAEVTRAGPHAVTLRSGQRLEAEHVVVATGPWARELTGLPVEPRKGQLVALAAPPGTILHKLVEAAYMESAADDGAGLSVATVIEQTLDGDEILIGASRTRRGFDPEVDPAVTAALIDRAARFVPLVAELPVTRAWCGFRPWLPDRLPAIGRLQGGVWTTTGHEGSGVGLGPISGLLLAQLICGETPLVAPEPFAPSRFATLSPSRA